MEYTKEEKAFYEKEFICGETTICRGDLESLPCPFCTKDVDDDTMQKLANFTVNLYRSRITDEMSDDRKSEIWWEELEDNCCYLNIPYYEDLED